MISVKKDFHELPEALTRPGCASKIQRAIDQKDGNVYNGHHYKDKSVKGKLDALYHNKCSYCESLTEHVATLQIEHYRPKAKVTVAKSEVAHAGYYWLGCEWSNLLLGCPKCNGSGAKGNNFKVQATQLRIPPLLGNGKLDKTKITADVSPLIDEKPYLLHPEVDSPEEHLSFTPDGEIESINQSEKAIYTIATCKLNRSLLVRERRKHMDKHLNLLELLITGLEAEDLPPAAFIAMIKVVFKEIDLASNPDQPYALLGKRIQEHFPTMIANKLPLPFQATMLEAYQKYQAGNL